MELTEILCNLWERKDSLPFYLNAKDAAICHNSEIAINGVVHIKTVLPENETVPIGWIAVGNPVRILPPDKHDERWAIQKPLNFPKFVYGVDRKPEGQTIMPEIMKMMTDTLESHKNDKIIG